METKYFILQLLATIGKSKADGELHHPVQLRCHAIVEGVESEDEARAKFTGYSEPGFKLELVSVTELGPHVKAEELYKLMPLSEVVTEIRI